MSYKEPFRNSTIALSISESDNLGQLGMANEHLKDAMTEISRHLLALGARLMYGGDLRPDTSEAPGFTTILFELVLRHRRDALSKTSERSLTNVLAWPVSLLLGGGVVAEYSRRLETFVEFVTLDQAGTPINIRELPAAPESVIRPDIWTRGLSAMRRWSVQNSDARIILGGKRQGYKGLMPGIAEETLLAIAMEQPIYVLGGFGGCARDIARYLGFLEEGIYDDQTWNGEALFSEASWDTEHFGNGLTQEENFYLASSPHVDEVATLILKGLNKVVSESELDNT